MKELIKMNFIDTDVLSDKSDSKQRFGLVVQLLIISAWVLRSSRRAVVVVGMNDRYRYVLTL